VIDRRRFVARMAAAGGLALLRPASLVASAPAAGRVEDLYRRAIVIDGLAEAFDTEPRTLPVAAAALAAAAKSGLTAVNFTVVGPGAGFEQTVAAIAYIERVVEADPETYLLVRRISDVPRAKVLGRLGLILGFQTTEMLGGDLARLELFRNLGVRVMQLTYNGRSLFGDGCLEPGNAGLSNLGREAVARMNELGIAVDVSHSGARTTQEAIAASARPILISHSGCRAVFDNPRNKEDAALRALAEKGGVVGIYLMPFLSAGPGPVTTEDLLRHVDHARDVCGEDHVGIGSDQGVAPVDDTPEYRKNLAAEVEARRKAGVSAPGESPDRPPFIPELNTARRMERIAEELDRRGYRSRAIEKILGANFERALGEIWEHPA
jgi:membrane dipeptidase